MASQPISGLLPKTLAPTPVPVCTEFFNYQTAIRLPNDTASVKYGTLDPRGPRFYDRRGKPFNIRAGLVPSTFTPEQEWPLYQTVFKAFLGKFGTVYKLEAALFVENAAMLRPFRGASFAGLAKVLGPPPGVPDSDWLFLTFENTVRNTSRGLNQNVGELWGTFVNRAKAVKFQNVCHRAFVSNATEQAYYSKYLGTTNKVTLAWFPGMHTPYDSELVITFSDLGGGYMTRAPLLSDLLKDIVKPFRATPNYTFGVHGNPVGAIYLMDGRFYSKANYTSC